MRIEYFLNQVNGWVILNIDDIINLCLRQENLKYNKIKSLLKSPIKILLHNEMSNPENFISGNYVEVLIQKELRLAAKNPKKFNITISNNENNKKNYDIWVQAKIISYDKDNNILLLEYNEELIPVDDMNKIRPLSFPKRLEEDISLYYIKKISNAEYEKFKKEFDNFRKETEEEKKYLLYQNYNSIKSSLFCFLPKNNILPSLVKFEEQYKFLNNEDSNTITTSAITSRSGRSEESENKKRKSKNSNILFDEEEILNDINKYNYKQIYIYNSLFKKDAEKIIKDIMIKSKYYLTSIDSEEFKIIIYGNNEKEFNKEKTIFENGYKAVKILNDSNINKNDMIELANNTNIKYIYFGNKYMYLIGEEKSISNFEALLNMNEMYTKEIEKSYIEKEKNQKKLSDMKREYKIK